VVIDLSGFSLAGDVRYELTKETADRSPLKVVREGDRLKVSASSGVSGNERIIGWVAITNADGASRLTWKRDDSDFAKHEDFVLVLRNHKDQIFKIKVKSPGR